MKRILTSLLLLIPIVSCDRYGDPSLQYIRNYSFYFNNSYGLKLSEGEKYPDTVRFMVYNNYTSFVDDSLRIEFEPLTGDGSVSLSSVFTIPNSTVKTTWQPGNGSFEQVLRASVFLPDGNFLSHADLNTYVFRENQWDKVSFQPDGTMSWMVADTTADRTFMISNSKLYRQGERYFDWNEVTGAPPNPRTLVADTNLTYFITTWEGRLFRSSDHGDTWIECTKPFAANNYFFYLYISNDNRLWATKGGYSTCYSDDGGLSWTTAAGELSKHGFFWIYRLSNGWYIFHGSDCCSLYKSEDNGVTWSVIPTPAPGFTHNVYVNDKDEIFIFSQVQGVTIYRSDDLGATFTPLVAVMPRFMTTMEQNIFYKCGNIYYVLIPGYGILRSSDLSSFQTYYFNDDLNNLFIDHNGVLIAKDWNWNTVYYMRNSQ